MSPPYLTHILTRLNADLDFLVSQQHLSETDARLIRTKLPSPSASSLPTPISTPVSPLPSVAAAPRAIPPPPPVQRVQTPAANAQPQARAKWDYEPEDPSDLRMSKGETITILEEVNADWWKGRNTSGAEGLFPSNRVEKLASPAPARTLPPPASYFPEEKAQYNPSPPPPNPYNAPSPAPSHSPYGPPAPYYQPQPPQQAPGPVYVQQPQEEEQKKKNKFGKLGSTMGNAAAGGVGFGAGAAIGGGIINAIF